MPLIETLPDALAHSLDLSRLRIAVAADITLSGDFGREWLLITDEALRVQADGAAEPRITLMLSDITGADAEALVGGGALMATIKGRRIELVRYTNAQQATFSRVASHLRELRTHREAVAQGKPSVLPELHADAKALKRCPRCRLLLEENSTSCPACVDKRKVLLRLMAYLRPHWKRALWVWFLMLLGMALNLVGPYLTKPLIDLSLAPPAGSPGHARATSLLWVVLGMLASGLGAQVIAIVRGRQVVLLGTTLTHQLRMQLYRHLQMLSLRYFDRAKVGQTIARVTQDTTALETVLLEGAQYFVVNILTLVGIGVVLLVMNWKLTLLVLIPVPVVLLASRIFWPKVVALWHRLYHVRGQLVSTVSDSVSGMRVVKAFAKEQDEIERFGTVSAAMQTADRNAELTLATFFPALSYITSTGTLLVTYFGGLQVIDAHISTGTLMAFTVYLSMFYGPLQWLSRIADWMARSLASSARVFEVLDTVPDVREAADAVAMPRIAGSIVFDKVVFGYDKHKPALKEVSFTVSPGEMVGLVGHSGAGKSTLINLICRFYEVDAGSIRIDDVDIRRISQHDLRSQIGVVLQESFLFNGTIAENIAYARPQASAQDIICAAKAANAHDFIVGKADGYDTLLGERGQTLSGGERQRIAIARAILHDPRVLILDEATASVDTDTEKQIQEAVARLVKGRTTFAIAHRLSTLRNADRLIVLKDGTIVETGTHVELLARKDGEFARLVTMQQAMSQIVEIG